MVELQQQRQAKIDLAQGVVDAATEGMLSDEETTTFNEHMASADGLLEQIGIQETLETAQASIAAPAQRQTPVAQPGSPAGNIIMPSHFRSKKLVGYKNDEDAYKCGMWVRAMLFGDDTAMNFCRENFPQNVMTTGVNTKGGFLVPAEFEQAVIDLRETFGVFRRNAKVVPMASDTKTQPKRTGGLTAYAVGDAESITASDKGWGAVNLIAKKWGVLARISSELDEDSVIDMVADLTSEMAYAFAEKEDDAGFNGDGTSTYHGVIGVRTKIIDGTHTAGAVDVATATHNLFNEIDAADLIGLIGALPQYANGSAKFYCSQYAKAQVFDRLKAAGGGNTASDLAAGSGPSYLGYPIEISQKMPMGAATDYDALAMILFGDLSMAAMLGNRRGMAVKVSEDRYLESDEIGIRGTTRSDINVHSLGDNTTAGPIVALIGSSS